MVKRKSVSLLFCHTTYCAPLKLHTNKRKPACACVDKSYYCAAEFLYWLLGENREPELPGLSTSATRQHLLNNCLHGQDEVSLETLRLFEVSYIMF